MKILTSDNTVLDLDTIGRELSSNVYFCVLDLSNKDDIDYHFRPLIMTESFSSVGVEFQIGNQKIILPQEWSIVLADPETGDVEIIPIDEINVRDFHAFSFNPIRNGLHHYVSIQATDVFTDINWTVPKLALHNFLLVPITGNDSPMCIYLINEKDQRKMAPLTLDVLV